MAWSACVNKGGEGITVRWIQADANAAGDLYFCAHQMEGIAQAQQNFLRHLGGCFFLRDIGDDGGKFVATQAGERV